MLEIFQQTLSSEIKFKGIGLHSGEQVNIKLLPAEVNQGIIFKRVDKKENNLIPALHKNIVSDKLSTTIANSSNISVSTIEPLMAALYITGIDNVLVEIDKAEVPILDGSSKNFVEEIKINKPIKQKIKRKFLKVLKKDNFFDNKKSLGVQPSNFNFKIKYKIDYDNKIIKNQSNEIDLNTEDLSDIYNSRTFCLFKDIEKIKSLGLAKGGSLDNAIVVDENKILNDGGLRNKNEFVNHKILDLIGDFYLTGFRIIGEVNCIHGGHALTNAFFTKFLKNKNNYAILDFNRIETVDFPKINTQNTLKATA